MEVCTGFWKQFISEESEKAYFEELFAFLEKAYATKTIYPPANRIFRAFELTPYETLNVVILGQDPYHDEKQADGLAFSVDRWSGGLLPRTLQNIFQELYDDVDVPKPRWGDLSGWAEQGVLLLNSILTVEDSKPSCHQGRGWEAFTDAVIRECSAISDRSLVFVLWGLQAQAKAPLIDGKRHLVLKGAHPSPHSAHNGFFKSKPFSKINNYLISQQKKPINWGNVS